MNNSFIEKSFIDNLRAIYANNDAGRYNANIASMIKKFGEMHLDKLIQICLDDETIAKICNLPIPALQQYWHGEAIKLGIATKRYSASLSFAQIMEYYSPNEAPDFGFYGMSTHLQPY